MVAAVGLGERGFVLGADCADDVGAEIIGPLAEDQPDAAGGSVNENVHAFVDLERAAQEVFGRHALEHHGGGLLVADIRRQFDGAIGRDDAFGTRNRRAPPLADPVADLEVGDAGPTAMTSPAPSLPAINGRPTGRRIHAHAEIGVDEIDAGRVLLDPDLSLPGRGQLNLFIGQNLGPADLMHAHRSNHFTLLSCVSGYPCRCLAAAPPLSRAIIGGRGKRARERLHLLRLLPTGAPESCVGMGEI